MASLVNSAAGYASWAVFPRLFTNILQQAYYKYRPSGAPPPVEGSREYARDRRRIYILVVTSYLLYTVWNTYMEIQTAGDFYKVLGVTPLASDKEIRSRYRRLATLLHPDKVRSSSDPNAAAEEGAGRNGMQEQMFMKLKLAYETISDPTQRFVYDRFGQVIVLNERQSESVRLQKLMLQALMNIAPTRLKELVLLTVLNVLWFPAWGRYWRFYAFFAAFTCEIILLTHLNTTLVLSAYLPRALSSLLHLDNTYLLPFQLLSLVNKTSVAIGIFISQVAPPSSSSKSSTSSSNTLLHPALDAHFSRLLSLVRETDQEASRLNQALTAPYAHLGEDEPFTVAEFRHGMRKALLDREKKASPEAMVAAQRAALKKANAGKMERKKEVLMRRQREEETMGVDVGERFAKRFWGRLVKVQELVREGNGVLDDGVAGQGEGVREDEDEDGRPEGDESLIDGDNDNYSDDDLTADSEGDWQ